MKLKNKIFYGIIIKHFRTELHDYFIARVPQSIIGTGSTLMLNKWSHVTGGNRIDKNGVIHGKTTEKHYNKGWNDCVEEMKSRVL
jgi:hypothetical protein